MFSMPLDIFQGILKKKKTMKLENSMFCGSVGKIVSSQNQSKILNQQPVKPLLFSS